MAIGTPAWWYTMAPAVRSFLAQHDFAGKTVVPFMINGGSRMETKQSEVDRRGESAGCMTQVRAVPGSSFFA